MKKILIAGDRPEVNRLFELLMWQPERQFVKANRADQCLDLARRTVPDLIVVDSCIADINTCHELLLNLKSSSGIDDKPLLLIAEPQTGHQAFNALLEIVDGVLPEPFYQDEVNNVAGSYLH